VLRFDRLWKVGEGWSLIRSLDSELPSLSSFHDRSIRAFGAEIQRTHCDVRDAHRRSWVIFIVIAFGPGQGRDVALQIAQAKHVSDINLPLNRHCSPHAARAEMLGLST
jgi:hypothetical protein